ncbi:class I SAM-dependent methyltransferase [Phyllobacterium sp. LjRoot231]|uniref:class I SAM-dependent methyltransferase n=1 Tax=Phyllobacterium sp. LjRoot231 TaxID=3342289 RepID=UPI003ED024FE
MIVPMSQQQQFWNQWNSSTREIHLDEVSFRQAEVVLGWLAAENRTDLQILEVGCGAGWFCGDLSRYGQVTATDLSDEVLARAQQRMPHVKFVSGDFMELEFDQKFDVLVTLEVLSHVADQPAFIAKLADHLRNGGTLMLATQNKPVIEKYNRVDPAGAGQLRKYVDSRQLTALLSKNFNVMEVFSVTPKANRGFMRILNSRTFNRPIRALVGKRLDEFKESIGLGWTLMARAQKKVAGTA